MMNYRPNNVKFSIVNTKLVELQPNLEQLIALSGPVAVIISHTKLKG